MWSNMLTWRGWGGGHRRSGGLQGLVQMVAVDQRLEAAMRRRRDEGRAGAGCVVGLPREGWAWLAISNPTKNNSEAWGSIFSVDSVDTASPLFSHQWIPAICLFIRNCFPPGSTQLYWSKPQQTLQSSFLHTLVYLIKVLKFLTLWRQKGSRRGRHMAGLSESSWFHKR